MKIIIFLCSLFWLGACVSSKPSTPTEDFNYSERLSKYRYEVEDIDLKTFLEQSLDKKTDQNNAQNKTQDDNAVEGNGEQINASLKNVLDKIAENNKKIKFVMGYAVQVYSGQDRDEANKIMRELPQYTQQDFALKYEEPSFKVMVGTFFNRYEAHALYNRLKGIYPNAIMVPDKIQLFRRD